MADDILLKGRVLSFTGSPFAGDPVEAVQIDSAVVLGDGKVLACGDATDLLARFPGAEVHDHGEKIILAGFVDTHVHYPQTAMIASWGKRLIDWLNHYTFPEEMRFADIDYATEVAGRYFDLTLAHGTTTAVSFARSIPDR